MLARIILAVVVGVVVTLICQLVGSLLGDLQSTFAAKIGVFLSDKAEVIGLLAALWFFFRAEISGIIRR